MTKIEKEVAKSEVIAWLDYKNVSKKKREEQEDQIDSLAESLQDGAIIINPESMEITHNLRVGIENSEGKVTVDKLIYVPRLKVHEIHDKMKGVTATDVHGMVLAYASALTKQPKQVIRNMDSVDYTVAQTIAIFFM